ncbi:MAG: c-type cytochrome [Acidobacteria bacterium]|nr:c-type cytochrome [Acidobacteriota bacterium]
MVRLLVFLSLAAICSAQKYHVGRPATSDEIKSTDQFMAPSGAGLPPGKGTAAEGRDIYSRRCARCHGAQGQGDEEGPLAGGKGTLKTAKPLKTVGSFWPYATTIYDYVHRAMPFDNPGLLDANQTYSVVALILHMNGIIGEKDEMNALSLPKVKMPNRDGFIKDNRPDTGKKKR